MKRHLFLIASLVVLISGQSYGTIGDAIAALRLLGGDLDDCVAENEGPFDAKFDDGELLLAHVDGGIQSPVLFPLRPFSTDEDGEGAQFRVSGPRSRSSESFAGDRG